MGEFPGIYQVPTYFNQLSQAMNMMADNMNTLANNQQLMNAKLDLLNESQNAMAADITTLVVRTKRHDAVLTCLAKEFDTAYPAAGLSTKINDILVAELDPA